MRLPFPSPLIELAEALPLMEHRCYSRISDYTPHAKAQWSPGGATRSNSWESYEVDLFYLGAAGICMSAALVGGQLEQKLEMPIVR